MDEQTPIPSGGDLSALDPRSERDRGLLRQALKNWPKRFRAITPEKRDNWVNDLEDARSTAKNIADGVGPPELKLAAVNTVRSCVQTSVMIDSVQQREEMAREAGALKDLHHQESLEQTDRHHHDKLNQDDKHLALGAADLMAKISDEEYIALAKRLGRLDLLPPALRARAGP